MKKWLLIIVSISTLSCSQKDSFKQLENIEWLIGTWKTNTFEHPIFEVWQYENDSTYSGYSYMVINGDTTITETILIQQQGNDLYYIPTVKNQNNEQPIVFRLTKSKQNELVFENPKHNFPTKITYTKITNDSIVAEISGKIDNNLQQQRFTFKKIR